MKHRTPVVIVAKPGRMRDSLEALLETKSQKIEIIIGQASDISPVVEMGISQRPMLVLLDTNLSNRQTWSVLKQVKEARSQNRCIVLADNTQQQQTALAAGADAALIKGFAVAELFMAVDRLVGLMRESEMAYE